ncbi:MAG TPA: M28 family peptidase [Bacteroidales bacterium]|nr:M28 family peptidase [Bacteroidales bacterium]HPS16137.1 M28 family peptidase [Bacteroidales bacterium]
MFKKYYFLPFLLFAFVNGIHAQQVSFYNQSDSAVAARLKYDDSALAHDSMLGREAGTEGEIKARDFIVNNFKKIGLTPLFENSYLQEFDVNGGANIGFNMLEINNNMFVFNQDFYPMEFSSSGTTKGEIIKVKYGINAPELSYDDYSNLKNMEGKIFALLYDIPDSMKKAGFDKYQNAFNRANYAFSKGATAVIFYNNKDGLAVPSKVISNNINALPLPVLFADKKAAKLINVGKFMNANIETNITRTKCNSSYNIGGYIDNKAKFTIVIGAHYDHIGYTTTSTGKRTINNGADDNASGTSAMIELARFYSDTTKEKYNFIFMAFSAEEKGLYGSAFFTESNIIDLNKVAFMINCDMVGRLDSIKKSLTIYSVGSSPAWKKIIENTKPEGLVINAKEAAESGSDHYSFYKKNIPDVFFFTELHSDYHKPGDDVNKVNFTGLTQIVKYIERFINNINSGKKLPFSRTTTYW